MNIPFLISKNIEQKVCVKKSMISIPLLHYLSDIVLKVSETV